MAYTTNNPPQCLSQGIGGKGKVWMYKSSNVESDYDDTDFITNARDLGMQDGDIVMVIDSATPLASIGKVLVDADGNGTLSALTAIS